MIDPDYKKRLCPVCGERVLLFFDVCEVCGWENDPLQYDDPDYAGGANCISLNEARRAHTKTKQ